MISHYDVNFLYVISLYARENDYDKAKWKEKVRVMFRESIQKMLESKFDFYVMTSKPGTDASDYIKHNFQSILGKLYRPYTNPDYFSLALERNEEFIETNKNLLNELGLHFVIKKISLGENPVMD